MQFATAGANVVSGVVVEVGERDGGHSHFAGGGGLHGLADHLCGGGNGDQVELLAKRADQDRPPEALDRPPGLSVLIEPVLERLPGVALMSQCERNQGARDRELVGRAQEREFQEGRRGVQRRGKRGRPHHGSAAAGLDEGHLVVPADLVGDADAVVKLEQIGADAKQNVLAVVDDFAGAGMFPRGSAAAEERALLEERDAESVVGQGAGGGESGETASGDGDCGLGSGGHA